jgi:hypothetical protein
MAIYQYTIKFIPRQSIIDKYGEIPNQFSIDQEAWEKHWEKEDIESDYDFEDALTISWWDNRSILFKNFEPFVDAFIKPVEWADNSIGSKRYGDDKTNDFSIELDTDGFIEDFNCRFDLRNLDKHFVINILSLAQQLDCLLLDRKGNLFQPTFEKLIENIKLSNSFNFVINPADFLNKFSNGIIKPE